ncbi:MAG TPA: glycosyl hydrolase-related protein [Capsulimonadaceae bacterium]
MPKQTCFLVCNAHLDPVWLWPWEDGMVEAISTFRVAADFCDTNPEFVFNHNESVLYEWVEEHDPALFARIQALVKQGRWHIAGGAYLQPDPIGTSGESMIRQYLVGKGYFRDKFGVEPTTAYNFDSFGHPRGMVQILAGCGFDSYVFCRPNRTQKDLTVGGFLWQHSSGAEVIARRSDDHYITQGELRKNMKDGDWPAYYRAEGDFMFLWGIGNHGGGPSRDEYSLMPTMRADFPDVEFVESTPEAFFARMLRAHPRETLPVFTGDLKHLHEGCYTSMLQVKQAHRRMENAIVIAEKLAAAAWWTGARPYPAAELGDAWKDILFAEFHDILPGSGIPTAERDCLVQLGHCEHILRRQNNRSIIGLLQNEPLAERNRTPIFVFNPNSWDVTSEVEIEYCLDRQYGPDQVVRTLTSAGEPVAVQYEKGENNLTQKDWGEWRQRAVFVTTIPAMSYRRYDTDYTVLPREQVVRWKTPSLPAGDLLTVSGAGHEVAFNVRTGLIESVKVKGVTVLSAASCAPLVFADTSHSWETYPEWREPVAAFALATPAEAAAIKGSAHTNPRFAEGSSPVTIIEDGAIRTVVEAIFVHDGSYIVQRYAIGKIRPVIDISQTIFWNKHDQALKLELHHGASLERIESEACYSIDDQTDSAATGNEHDMQHFVWLHDGSASGLGVVPYGTSAFSRLGSDLRLNVLRSPAYACMDDATADFDRMHDRYIPRHDQGLRQTRFTLVFGDLAAERATVARTAWEYQTPLTPFVYFPTNATAKPIVPQSFLRVDAPNVLLTAMKQAETGDDLVVRFWETAGQGTEFTVTFDGNEHRAYIGANSVQTYRITREGVMTATDMLERVG